jgi:uncharacterized membrane protein YuzA (DUF378 family)
MLDRISLILVIIGAINWLLVGLFSFDLVAMCAAVRRPYSAASIYTLVGVAGSGASRFCSGAGSGTRNLKGVSPAQTARRGCRAGRSYTV